VASKISGDADEPIAEINIVPFVDIILVVLIIFMVTTPIIMNPSINVNLPEASSGEESSPTQLVITVNKDGQYLLNGNLSDLEAIKAFALEQVKKTPFIQAVISADRDVSHGHVITAIDAIKSVGVKKFAISVDKR
jgi:biopolymer transport protein ExbD